MIRDGREPEVETAAQVADDEAARRSAKAKREMLVEYSWIFWLLDYRDRRSVWRAALQGVELRNSILRPRVEALRRMQEQYRETDLRALIAEAMTSVTSADATETREGAS